MKILSLFDYTGNWPLPYKQNGFEVIQVEIKLGTDIMTWDYTQIEKGSVYGILAAPPCTHYSVSGAQYWPEKDKDGRTEESNKLVRKTLEIIKYFDPYFWVLENPVGRIDACVPELKKYYLMSFNPCDYGNAYTKKTKLWGEFNPWLVQNPVKPERVSSQGSWLMKLGGKSEKTKTLRSKTPMGFAWAFYNANSPASWTN